MPWDETRYPTSMRPPAAVRSAEGDRDCQCAPPGRLRGGQGDPHRDRQGQGVGAEALARFRAM